MANKQIKIREVWQKPITKDTKILVWVSWWPDSMYLLWTLKNFFRENAYSPENIHIISCDHQTRLWIAEEMTTVKWYSNTHIRQCIQYFGGKTTEDALRQRRHREFIKYAHKENIWLIYLGHHLDDRIETTLLHMQQGCGKKWFMWMSVKEKHFLDPSITIVRPLLWQTKDEILKECQKHMIPYHIDPTNKDIQTSTRNGIRQYIQILSGNNKFKESRKRIYNHYESKNNEQHIETNYRLWWYHYHPSYNEAQTRILTIDPKERSAGLLYMIYEQHNKSIRPRTTTLVRLAEQLQHNNASISYKGIAIQSKKYISIIKIKE